MVTRVLENRRISPRLPRSRGVTLVELIFGLIIAAILVAIAAPALQVAMGRNSVDAEAQRLISDIRFARSEAITRGVYVNICISVASTCDPGDPATCRCRSGVPAKRWDQGWLIYTAANGRDDFNSDRDQLIRIGIAARIGVEMRSNVAIQHRMSFNRAGALQAGIGGRVAVCQDGESTEEIPGKMINLAATGHAGLATLLPGEDCLTLQGRGPG